jgi:hypothetical protein
MRPLTELLGMCLLLAIGIVLSAVLTFVIGLPDG